MAKATRDPTALEQLDHNTCSGCELPLLSCWQFRDDDQFCSLCEKKILHLLLGQLHLGDDGKPRGREGAAPRGDERLWLYHAPGKPLVLGVVWGRGVEGTLRDANGLVRAPLRPPIDCEASTLGFQSRVGWLEFAWKPFPGKAQGPTAIVLLEPKNDQQIPAQVMPGRLRVVCPPTTVERQALLLPWPEFECKPVDRGLASPDGVLQINQRNTRVPLEMVLKATTHVWVMGCRVEAIAGGEKIELRWEQPGKTLTFGEPIALEADRRYVFRNPIKLEPDKPLRFRLDLDSSRWQPQQVVELNLSFTLHSLPPLQLKRRLKLFQGSRISFASSFGNTHILSLQRTVQLGQVEDHAFTLEVATDEGKPPEAITITHIDTLTTPATGDWLRVAHPTRERLPYVLEPGTRDQLAFQIDTRRLDREQLDNQRLEGEIRLIDAAQRHWVCYIQAIARRPQQLTDPLAFDWGTTNSCVARVVGKRPVSVPLDDRQKENRELFPSDIYFKDISNKESPVIEIGYEAQAQALDHPECLVRSVKRKFQFLETLPITDERGQRDWYPVDKLVRLLLRSLVSRVERFLEQEVGTLHLSFPTKWPPSVRKRLTRVASALQEQLCEERPSVQVKVEPPQIDEANAVAIQLLTDREARSKLKLTGNRFYLIAYDFGGGTVDTSVLEVTVDPETADVRTRYVGIGGREDFGGDEVTRAVMMLLHDKLTTALFKLKCKIAVADKSVAATLLEVPMVPDGAQVQGTDAQSAHRARWGRQNWEKLWEIAERAKVELSHNPDGTNIASLLLPSADSILCRMVEAGGQPLDDPVKLDTVLKSHDDRSFDLAREINFTLAQAWEHPLATRDDLVDTGNVDQFTVQKRIEDTIGELKWQCEQAEIQPDVVVLAGGGCRLPLIQQKIHEAFPHLPREHVIFDPKFSKLRVAFGLAQYLEWVPAGAAPDWLARSVDVVHHALGVRERCIVGGFPELVFERIVPVGTPIDAPTWHPFDFAALQLWRDRSNRRLVLYLQVWQEGPQEVEAGWFDLEQPVAPQPGDNCLQEPLPELAGGRYKAEMRLRGANQVEIRVLVDGRWYGLYRLQAKVPRIDLEDLLQGPPRRKVGGLS